MLEAPFPYFGGKSPIAHIIWTAMGDVKHYIEPFCGSAAVLFARPNYDSVKHAEAVCDKDGMICNVWRSLQFAPDEVARWCDWPVNHADLSARRKKLIENEQSLLEKLIADDEYFDAKLAGYWIWAESCWIGGGLIDSKSNTKLGRIPHISSCGQGVHKLGKRPHISNSGRGIHKLGKRPHYIIDGGTRPLLSDSTKDVREPYNTNIYTWFRTLSERLRYVRVVCGDWTRVCGGDWQDDKGICGMYFDPPYGVQNRHTNIYCYDSTEIAKNVLDFVRERGKRKTYRIVVSGYEEYEDLLAEDWTMHQWTAQGGYGNLGNAQGKFNRHRERLYFSPYCINPVQKSLF
jgi:DNA adenine methylase